MSKNSKSCVYRKDPNMGSKLRIVSILDKIKYEVDIFTGCSTCWGTYTISTPPPDDLGNKDKYITNIGTVGMH